MITANPEKNNNTIFNFFDSVSNFINPDDEIQQKNIDNKFREVTNKKDIPLYEQVVKYDKTDLQLPLPMPPKPFIQGKEKDIKYELQVKPEISQYALLGSDVTQEEQNILNAYSNCILLQLNDEYYITPKLLDYFDLNSSKLNKNEFKEIYGLFSSILTNSNINIQATPDSMFERYEKLINSTNTITKELFIMNVAMLLMFNLNEPFIQKIFNHLPYKYKTNKIQKGGTTLLNTLKNVLGKTLESSVEGIKNVGTFAKYGFRLDYLKASGGIDIFNSILSTTQIVLPLYLTVRTLNGFFGTDESSENVSIMALMCYSLLMKQAYSMMKRVGTEVYYNIHDINTQNYLNTLCYLNFDGVERFINEYNFKLSKEMAERIKKLLSSYLTSKYESSMKMTVKDLNQLNSIHYSFQNQKGYLTDELKQKEFLCAICINNFKYYEYGNQGYIHEELSDEEKGILSQDLTTTLEENKETYKEALKKKINSFPCNQFIDILSSKGNIPTKYNLDSNYGTRATDNSGRYGDQLTCSNCAFEQIKGQYVEGTWPLFLSSQEEQIFLNVEQLRELISNLSPKELQTISQTDYDSNILSYSKINQINENQEKKIKYGPDIELINVECPVCSPDVKTRFQGLYTKDDVNMLYLHCNACNSSFNGCDRGSPYVLTIRDYDELINESNRDICRFIQLKKLKEKRIEGHVRVSLDKYREIKKHQIKSRWSNLSQEITKINEKKCPRCKRYNILETGCSAIICSCGETYCYVCSQKIGGQGGHDTNHFLTNINGGNPILGGYYSVQCVNVNFTIIDPDNNPGIHTGYTQVINGTGMQIRPNPEYATVTKNTWRRYNYYRDKLQRLHPQANDATLQGLLYNNGDFWPSMNNIYYNFMTDKAYELGDTENDPDQLVNGEISKFEEEFETTHHDPIFDIKDIIDLIDLKDIEVVINEREEERNRESERRQVNPDAEPVLVVVEEDDGGVEEEKAGEPEHRMPLPIEGAIEERRAEFPEFPIELLEDENRDDLIEYERADVPLQQLLIDIYQNRDEEEIIDDYRYVQEIRNRVEDRMQGVQNPEEMQLLNQRQQQIQQQLEEQARQRDIWHRYFQPIDAQQMPPIPPSREMIGEDHFTLPERPTSDDLDGLNNYRRRIAKKRREELVKKGAELVEVNASIKSKWDAGAGAGAGKQYHMNLPNKTTMDRIRNDYIQKPGGEQQLEPRFYANGVPIQRVEQIKEVKVESIEDRGFNKQFNDSNYDRIINDASARINELTRSIPLTIETQQEIEVLTVLRLTFEKHKQLNIPYNYVDNAILKIFEHGKDILKNINLFKTHNISHIVICRIEYLGTVIYKKFYGNETSQELFDITKSGIKYRKRCDGTSVIIPIDKLDDMIKTINLVSFNDEYRMPTNVILNDHTYYEYIYRYGENKLNIQNRVSTAGGKKVLKHKKTKRSKLNKYKINKKTKRGGKIINKRKKTKKGKIVLKNRKTKRK